MRAFMVNIAIHFEKLYRDVKRLTALRFPTSAAKANFADDRSGANDEQLKLLLVLFFSFDRIMLTAALQLVSML